MDLTSLASVATILAIPVAIVGWFVSRSTSEGTRAGGGSEDVNGARSADVPASPSMVASPAETPRATAQRSREPSASLRSGSEPVAPGRGPSPAIEGDHRRTFDSEVLLDAQAAIYSFRLRAGRYWKFPDGHMHGYSRVVIDLRDVVQRSGTWYADTKVDIGGGLVAGGQNTDRVATNTFLIPVTDHQLERDELCVFSLFLSPESGGFIRFLVLRVTHIDKHDKVATFELCQVGSVTR